MQPGDQHAMLVVGVFDDIIETWKNDNRVALVNNLDDLGQPWSCEQWGESHQVENPIIIDGQSCLDCNNNYPFVNWFGYAYTDYVFLDHNMKVLLSL